MRAILMIMMVGWFAVGCATYEENRSGEGAFTRPSIADYNSGSSSIPPRKSYADNANGNRFATRGGTTRTYTEGAYAKKQDEYKQDSYGNQILEPVAVYSTPQTLSTPPQALSRPPQALSRPPQALSRPPQALSSISSTAGNYELEQMIRELEQRTTAQEQKIRSMESSLLSGAYGSGNGAYGSGSGSGGNTAMIEERMLRQEAQLQQISKDLRANTVRQDQERQKMYDGLRKDLSKVMFDLFSAQNGGGTIQKQPAMQQKSPSYQKPIKQPRGSQNWAVPPQNVAPKSQPYRAPSVAPQPYRQTSSNGREAHRVGSGDTLSSIAKQYRVNVNTLMSLNGLHDPNFVYVGQKLYIPQR